MTTYYRDFADADGISDWTEDRYANGASWSISSGVLTGGSSANVEALTWNDIDADSNRANVEVYGQFRTNSTTNSTRALCIVRGNSSTGSSGSEYYQLALRNSTLRASYKLNGGSLTSITDPSHGLTIAANTWYGYRFRVIQDGSVARIYGRVWDASGSEPGTWLIDGASVTDSNITAAGVVGVQKTAVTNTHDWRYFGVGTNGDTAPTSAGGVNGSVTATLAAATVNATGAVSIAGAASQTLAALASSASGALALSGTASVALANAAMNATGELASTAISGALSTTMADAALSASGSVALAGALSGTLAAATLAAEGTSQDVTVGTLTSTLADVSAYAAGHVDIAAELGVALGDLVVGGVGSLAIAGAASAALSDVSLSAEGSAPLAEIGGSVAATLAMLSLTATGAEATVELAALAGYTVTGRARMFEVDGRSRRFEVPR